MSQKTKRLFQGQGIVVSYSLAELDHEEALVEVRAAVGSANEVLLLVALVLATRSRGLGAKLEVLRLHICGEEKGLLSHNFYLDIDCAFTVCEFAC